MNKISCFNFPVAISWRKTVGDVSVQICGTKCDPYILVSKSRFVNLKNTLSMGKESVSVERMEIELYFHKLICYARQAVEISCK